MPIPFKPLITTGMVTFALIGLPSCQVFEANPAASSGFNATTTAQATRAAFLQASWVAAPYRGWSMKEHFSAIYVAPVNTRYMEQQSWWQQQNTRKEALSKDSRMLAQRMQTKFQQTITSYPNSSFKSANGPGPGVLVLELALVELVPSKAFWNVGAGAAGFVVPGAGFLALAGAGSIAIEGRVRDGATNAVIATFKDRRNDKAAPINIGSYTWYHGAEINVAAWAGEFAELFNTPPDHIVKRPSPVTLRPW